jgi:hypothetical protein
MRRIILSMSLVFVCSSSLVFAAWCPPTAAIAPAAKAREAKSHPTQSGVYVSTSAQREKEMLRAETSMIDMILNYHSKGNGDIPPMRFFPAESLKSQVKLVVETTGDHGIITKYRVSGLQGKDYVEGTLLLPVSGHNGNANAYAWSKSDKYTLAWDTNLRATARSQWGKDGKIQDLLVDVPSRDLVTFQDIRIPLLRNTPIVLLYYRLGRKSWGGGEPDGYVEGRVIEFTWDGT